MKNPRQLIEPIQALYRVKREMISFDKEYLRNLFSSQEIEIPEEELEQGLEFLVKKNYLQREDDRYVFTKKNYMKYNRGRNWLYVYSGIAAVSATLLLAGGVVYFDKKLDKVQQVTQRANENMKKAEKNLQGAKEYKGKYEELFNLLKKDETLLKKGEEMIEKAETLRQKYKEKLSEADKKARELVKVEELSKKAFILTGDWIEEFKKLFLCFQGMDKYNLKKKEQVDMLRFKIKDCLEDFEKIWIKYWRNLEELIELKDESMERLEGWE